jgi:hypothetical protein
MPADAAQGQDAIESDSDISEFVPDEAEDEILEDGEAAPAGARHPSYRLPRPRTGGKRVKRTMKYPSTMGKMKKRRKLKPGSKYALG